MIIMAFTKTEFQPANKLPASKVNEIQDAILEHEDKLDAVDKSISSLQGDVKNLNTSANKSIKSINGATPDENGNIEIESGGVTQEDLETFFPETTKIDFTNWVNGSFTETLADGSTVKHDVLYDGNGNVISVGDITIEGVD
jgi:hypothetical protein